MGTANDALILKENRLLRNNEEIERFENALENILNNKNYKDIKYLCSAFDDNTENDEVMFELIHAIESYDSIFEIQDTMTEFVKFIPDVISHAREWTKILIKRILNDENSLQVYTEVFNSCDNNVKAILINLMNEIKVDNPNRFQCSVDMILSSSK